MYKYNIVLLNKPQNNWLHLQQYVLMSKIDP